MVNAALRQKPSEPHYQREISSLFRCSPSANELVYVRVVRVVPLTDDYNTRTGNRKLICNFSGDYSVSSYREENRRKSRAASSRQNRKTVSQSLSSDRRFCSKLFASWEDPMEWLSAVRAVPREGSQQSDGMNNNDSQERVHFIISNGILIETVFHFPVHLTDHQIEALSDGMYSMLYCDIQSRVSRSKPSYRRATDILTDLAHCRVGLSPDRCQSLGMHHDALGLTVHLDEWDTRVTPLSIVYFHIQHVPVRTSIPSSHAVTRTLMHNPRALRQQRKGIEVTQDFHTTHEKKDWSSTSGAEAQNFCTAQSEHYVGSTPLAEEITCTIKKQDVTFMNAFQFINKQFNTLHALLDDHRTRIIAELQASHKVQRCEILNGSAHTAFDVQMDMTAVVRALRQCLNLKINVNGQSLTVLWKDCTSQVAALRAMEEAQETDPALNQPDPVNLELFTLQLQKKYPRLAFVTDQSVTHSCMILFYMEDDADSKAFAENEADIYLRKRELHSENAFSYPTESNSACAQSQNCDSTGVDRGSAGVANEPHFRVAFVAFRKNVHIYLEEEDDMNTIIHGFPTRRFHVQGPFLHATMLEKPLHWLTADLCTEVSGGRFSF